MAFFEEEDLNKVREASDLAQIVGQYSPLRPRGRDLWCCCPLHHEKTPSFKINPATQTWHCFGCGEGGDVFSFVMKMEDLSFPEAVESLADRAHIDLPKRSGGNRPQSSRKELLRKICTATAEFYHLQLMRSPSPDAAAAREYLASRGLGGSVPKTWQLGFAPGSGTLTRHLRSLGFSSDAAIEANVLTRSKSGQVRDRFFNRVMFPINDVSGQCIAFGGRIIGAGEPKYLNSQETPLFHKSSVLYGLDHAKGPMAATGVAIVVEGYTDVIALSEAGIKNVVATLGTALTLNHIRLLARHANQRIIYLFDGDAAGQKAADRALNFIDESMTPEAGRVRVGLDAVVLPDNLDPADFVGERGADALRELLADAMPLVQFGIERRLAAHDLSSAEGRSAALMDALSVLAPIKDSLLAKDYAVQIASRVHAREEDALARLAALKPPLAVTPSGDQRQRPEGKRRENAASSGADERSSHRSRPAGAAVVRSEDDLNRYRSERAYLGLLTTHRDLALAEANSLTSIAWQHPLHRRWADELIATLAAKPTIGEAELVGKIIHEIAESEGAISAASGTDSDRAAELSAYLREELVLGDMEERIAALRDRLAHDSSLNPEDYEKLFSQAVSMQQDLNQRRLSRRSR